MFEDAVLDTHKMDKSHSFELMTFCFIVCACMCLYVLVCACMGLYVLVCACMGLYVLVCACLPSLNALV